MSLFHDLLILVARLCMSSLFLWAGIAKVIHWQGTLDYLHSKRVPWAPFAIIAAVFVQIIGGFSLLLGYQTRIGVILLILFIIPAAYKMHDFWNLSGDQRTIEKTFFMKDVAILGGLLLMFVTGAGRFSFHG